MRKLTDLFSLTAILGLPVLLAVTLPMLAVPQAASAADDAPGKAVFVAQKCNVCHSVDAQSIARTSQSDKMKGPDLSSIGKDHDAAWISKWLKKDVDDGKGKKHMPTWKGTDEELKQVTEWLAAQKK